MSHRRKNERQNRPELPFLLLKESKGRTLRIVNHGLAIVLDLTLVNEEQLVRFDSTNSPARSSRQNRAVTYRKSDPSIDLQHRKENAPSSLELREPFVSISVSFLASGWKFRRFDFPERFSKYRRWFCSRTRRRSCIGEVRFTDLKLSRAVERITVLMYREAAICYTLKLPLDNSIHEERFVTQKRVRDSILASFLVPVPSSHYVDRSKLRTRAFLSVSRRSWVPRP